MKTKTKLNYIEDYPMDKIKPYGKNPRINDQAVPAVSASMDDFGNNDPIQITPEGIILAGHTRYKALTKKGVKTARVIVVEGLNDEEQKAYRLAHNKVGEIAEWDAPMLMEELGGIEHIDMEELGFGEGEIIDTGEPIDVQEDDFDEETDVNEHGVKRGDVWQLGEHRLMCGDSTSQSDVMVLMNGNLADIVFTDPPWNVSYGERDNPKWKTRTILNDSMSTEDFKNFMGEVFERMKESLKGGGIVYVVMSAQEWGNLMLELKDKGMHWSSTIIWAKDSLILSRKDYHTQYEPIWYGWEESKPRVHEVEDRKQSDVWQIPRPKKSDEHPTMKPVELVARALQNSSNKGDRALDLFGGSGTTLIASEETGRKCCMMELDPHYCDVIISRWEKLTGLSAKRVNA